MKLYTYWRSTTSYRVRIALNLKGLAYEAVPVDLVAGNQRSPEYTALNPGQGVPTLVLDEGTARLCSLCWADQAGHGVLLRQCPRPRRSVPSAATLQRTSLGL